MRLWLRVSVPRLKIPPPWSVAALADTVLLISLSVPALKMPPLRFHGCEWLRSAPPVKFRWFRLAAHLPGLLDVGPEEPAPVHRASHFRFGLDLKSQLTASAAAGTI
jgi:hypothetical protein